MDLRDEYSYKFYSYEWTVENINFLSDSLESLPLPIGEEDKHHLTLTLSLESEKNIEIEIKIVSNEDNIKENCFTITALDKFRNVLESDHGSMLKEKKIVLDLKDCKAVCEEHKISLNESKEIKRNDEEPKYTESETDDETENRCGRTKKISMFKFKDIFQKIILKETVKFRFDKYIFENTISLQCSVGLKFKKHPISKFIFTSLISSNCEEQVSLNNLSKDMEKLFQENMKYDLQMSCNNFKAHKAILFCRCPSLMFYLKDCFEDSKKLNAINNDLNTLQFCFESIHLNDLTSHTSKHLLKDYTFKLFEDSIFTEENIGKKDGSSESFNKIKCNSDELKKYFKTPTLKKKAKSTQFVRGIHSGLKKHIKQETNDETKTTGICDIKHESLNISAQCATLNAVLGKNISDFNKDLNPQSKVNTHESFSKYTISATISSSSFNYKDKNETRRNPTCYPGVMEKPLETASYSGAKANIPSIRDVCIERSADFSLHSEKALETASYSGAKENLPSITEVCIERSADFSLHSEKELRITSIIKNSDFLHNSFASTETPMTTHSFIDEEWDFEIPLSCLEDMDMLSGISKPETKLCTSTVTDNDLFSYEHENNFYDFKLDSKYELLNTKYDLPASCTTTNSIYSNSKDQIFNLSSRRGSNAEKNDNNSLKCDNTLRGTNILHMKNIDPHAFYWILRYIYSGSIDVNNPFLFMFTCFRVYVYAKNFGLKQLAKILAPVTMKVQSSIKTEKCSFISIVDQCKPGIFYKSPNYVTPKSKKMLNLFLRYENPNNLVLTLIGLNEICVQYKFNLILYEKNNSQEIKIDTQLHTTRTEKYSTPEANIDLNENGIEPANIKFMTVRCSLKIYSYHNVDDSEIIYPLSNAESNTENLSKDLRTLFESKKFSDVRLRAGDMTFNAHKFMLAARSVTFASLFKMNIESELDLDDIDGSTLESLLIFIYSGKIDNWRKNHLLYEAAIHYKIEDLAQLCRSYLKNNFTDSLVCDVLIIAHKSGDLDLFNAAKSFARRNSSKVLLTPSGLNLMKNHANIANEILEETTLSFMMKMNELLNLLKF